ncbi:hypothetical protein F2Q69_00013011 [Brassica cretica]|uniref:Arabidopsis retrotransposon Orf1 C-terminal domain-containing protein n=1 Tax=Brassica cretica TaxID=69181 RepID=A0A8S9QLE0_BRACR|nr:hypothetical protein F2Q69_00013011 [Brassica cretica]
MDSCRIDVLGVLGRYIATEPYDPTGPAFLDASYLKKAQYFSGRFNGTCVYSYIQSTREVEVLLPNTALTSLTRPGAIRFDIGSEHFLGPHGPLGPMRSPKRKKTADKCGLFQEDASGLNSELLYGPPRYHFEQHPGALPHGPLRQAHEHIRNLERWNKAQDRTIFKLKEKCKALSKTVKRQAEASAQFMKKVADILTRGAIAGCSSSDFDFLTPQPQPSIALKLLPSIVSQLRDLCGSFAISASCCTISATSMAPSRARILATGSGPLRPKPLIAAHYADDLENLYKVYGVDRSVILDLVGTHETPETVREGYYGAYLSLFHSCGLIFPIPEPILEANNEFSENLEKRLQDVSCSGELYEIKKVIRELKRANATQLAAAEKLETQAASLEARLRVVSNERKSALEQVSFLEVRVESLANKFSDDLPARLMTLKRLWRIAIWM